MEAITNENVVTFFVLRKLIEIPLHVEIAKEAEVILVSVSPEKKIATENTWYFDEETNDNTKDNSLSSRGNC